MREGVPYAIYHRRARRVACRVGLHSRQDYGFAAGGRIRVEADGYDVFAFRMLHGKIRNGARSCRSTHRPVSNVPNEDWAAAVFLHAGRKEVNFRA